jgi:hypothetical protein
MKLQEYEKLAKKGLSATALFPSRLAHAERSQRTAFQAVITFCERDEIELSRRQESELLQTTVSRHATNSAESRRKTGPGGRT